MNLTPDRHGCLVYCSTQTTNPTNRHELINCTIRGILQISCPNRDALRLCYDTGMVDLRINIRGITLESLKYCQEFTKIYKNLLRILHERI